MNIIKNSIIVLILFILFNKADGQSYPRESYELINQILENNHITLLDINSNRTNGLLSGDSITFNPKDFTFLDDKRLVKSSLSLDALLLPEDFEFIKNQLLEFKQKKYWDKDSLPDFTQLYKLKKFIPLLPKNWNIKRHNPPSPLTSLSIPVFNSKRNIAFVERGLYYGFSSGFSALFIYVKRDDLWIEFAVHQLWAM